MRRTLVSFTSAPGLATLRTVHALRLQFGRHLCGTDDAVSLVFIPQPYMSARSRACLSYRTPCFS